MSNDNLKKTLKDLIKALSNITKTNFKVVIGLDGFVDQILHVVETRTDANNYIRMKTLKDFGEMICRAAGLSANVEFIPIKQKLGGNGPIMSNALSTYGLDITYKGALGLPSIHPVFEQMSTKCNVISISNPGLTDAVEFLDGKLMIGKRECLKDINWSTIKEKIGLENLINLFQEADIIGLENWTMLPYMTSIWEGLINEVLPNLNFENKKYIFFDLADPENRLKQDILSALSVMKDFSSKYKVILGLNQKEAYEIAEVLDINTNNSTLPLETLSKCIYEKIGIYSLVIHPVKEACTICDDKYYYTQGPYEPNPKLTTGAGDNFNAGFCFGQVLGLSPQLSILLGTATSGYYVRNGESPNLKNLLIFLQNWANKL